LALFYFDVCFVDFCLVAGSYVTEDIGLLQGFAAEVLAPTEQFLYVSQQKSQLISVFFEIVFDDNIGREVFLQFSRNALLLLLFFRQLHSRIDPCEQQTQQFLIVVIPQVHETLSEGDASTT
jgi:hypothetical protein